LGNLGGKDHFGDLSIEKKIILEWILEKWNVNTLIWLRIGATGGQI
jgi:hypothetical protein